MANKKRLCIELATAEDIKLRRKLRQMAFNKEMSLTQMLLGVLREFAKRKA